VAPRLWRFLLTTALLLAAGLLVRRTMHLRGETSRTVPSPDPWPPITETLPLATAPVPAAEAAASAEAVATAEAVADLELTELVAAWLPPVDGVCPPTHLIKAKAASGIYHLPGTANYERTKPDRCYADTNAAEADGFIRAKR